jgi:signal transduction histidine kinase
MKRPWHIAAAFGLALALALGGMVWVTLSALRLDRAEARARRQAVREENVRLALWRMDSLLTPLIARESGHPYFAYTAFYPAERAYTRMFAEIRRGEVLMPSPLLAPTSPRVRLYFQFGPKGRLTSPQVPAGNMRDLAEGRGYADARTIDAAAERLNELAALTGRDALLAQVPEAEPRRAPAPLHAQMEQLDEQLGQAEQQMQAPQQGQVASQQRKTSLEARARFQAAQQAFRANAPSQSIPKAESRTGQTAVPSEVVEGVMRPVWVGDALLLARRVRVGGDEYVQGTWLNWPTIRAELAAEIAELLPQARLEPLRGESAPRTARVLATLPVRLLPGPVPEADGRGGSAICVALLIAWVCVLGAGVALGGLLVGAVSLSERRADFVSAVTHELRTPLTTFRMYAEMLAEGMVTDEQKRRRYLDTLGSEANRLSHLVENVLAYARLERRRTTTEADDIAVDDLVERVEPHLRERLEREGRSLHVEVDDALAEQDVRADASVVEQILLNLVDNACKYAASADDGQVHLEARQAARHIELRVRDHGPGVTPPERRKLFRPFSKSARDAARSAQGIGLGLALSRRLARDMGGDLRLDHEVSGGACFVLELPLSKN